MSVASCHAVEITGTSSLFVIEVPKIQSRLDPERKGNSCLRNVHYSRLYTVRYAEDYGERFCFPQHMSSYSWRLLQNLSACNFWNAV
jgi:hypothetical protein